LRNHAYDLFAEFIYEEEPSSGEFEIAARFDLFNFDLNDDQASHHAIPVPWRRELQEFDPIHRPDSEVRGAFGAFDDLTKYVQDCLPRGREPTES
jgi:hypothetical protein